MKRAALNLFYLFFNGAALVFAYTGQVIEEDFTYKAVKGDYIERIARMNGLELARFYELNPEARKAERIYPGDTFRISMRTIVPAEMESGILVNIPDRTLYRFRDG